MAMDYGESAAPSPSGKMGTYAIEAATSTHMQLMSLLASFGINDTDTQVWTMQGITPMIGINDDQNEIFTLADAQQVLTFAQQKSLGYLSFWSATRDHAVRLRMTTAGSAKATTPFLDSSPPTMRRNRPPSFRS